MALSFFVTQQQAEARFQSLARSNKKIRLTLGTHLAQVAIQETDGLSTPPSHSGHFDLFEEQECDFSGRCVVVGPL